MKQLILIFTFFLFTGVSIQAQEKREGDPVKKEQKIKALYVAYISQELKLTEEEAQKFWPVHSQFDTEIRSVQHDISELDRQQLVLNVKKKYQDKFVRILGTDRSNDFFRKDAEFRKKLVERLHNLRQPPGDKRVQFRKN